MALAIAHPVGGQPQGLASMGGFGQALGSSLLSPERVWAGGPSAAQAAVSLAQGEGDAPLHWPRTQGLALPAAGLRVVRPFKLLRELPSAVLAEGAGAWVAEAVAALGAHVEGLTPAQAEAIAQDAVAGAAWVLALSAQLRLGAWGALMRLSGEHQGPCWKLHVDNYPFRVLGSWWGPGPEWAEGMAVRRDRLGCGHGHPEVGGEDAVLPDPRALHQARPGELLLLPGKGYPGRQGRGTVHRSPSLASGADRLVLAIDPIVGR